VFAGNAAVKTKTPKRFTCFQCRFFYITYDKHFPYGCREMGFKSRKLPMHEVLLNSNMPCLAFSRKPKRTRKPKP